MVNSVTKAKFFNDAKLKPHLKYSLYYVTTPRMQVTGPLSAAPHSWVDDNHADSVRLRL